MSQKKIVFFLIVNLFVTTLLAQNNVQSVAVERVTPQAYIDNYKNIAIAEMKRSGVPASITLAQGILESDCGNGELVKKSNNHFGIKCKSTWTGETVTHDDDALGECFRKYKTDSESFTDHTDFLKNNQRYAGLFLLEKTDYKGWCYGLKKAGYATNPKYPQLLITQIEKYNLMQYDTVQSEIVATSKLSFPDYTFEHYNGISAVFIKNQKTSVSAVAADLQMSMEKILAFNDLENDAIIDVDDFLYLEAKLTVSKQKIIRIEEDMSLRELAQLIGLQLQSILSVNNFQKQMVLKKGTLVNLPTQNL